MMKFVFCPVCSKENDAESATCQSCGRHIHPSRQNNKIIDLYPSQIREVTESQSSGNEKIISATTEELVGVKGVLTFLCVILIVFIPVMWIGPLREILSTDYSNVANFPAVQNFVNYTKYSHIFFSVISICTGIAIMCKFKGAIGIAKLYWLMQPILILLYGIGLFRVLSAIDPSSTNGLIGEIIFQLIGSIFWGCVWLAYLSKSKRVHATYELKGIRESLQAYGTDGLSIVIYVAALAFLVFLIT